MYYLQSRISFKIQILLLPYQLSLCDNVFLSLFTYFFLQQERQRHRGHKLSRVLMPQYTPASVNPRSWACIGLAHIGRSLNMNLECSHVSQPCKALHFIAVPPTGPWVIYYSKSFIVFLTMFTVFSPRVDSISRNYFLCTAIRNNFSSMKDSS